MMDWLPRLVARVPATVHVKLLASFLAIVALLLIVGAVGLRALYDVNRRAEDIVKLQRKIAAYRQLQHDTTAQLYTVASALLVPDERTFDATLRQLNQFGYDLDRLQFVAKDEVELLGQVREDYEQFIKVVTRVVELIRAGRAAEGRELQLTRAGSLADRLERLTNELVNKAEADMVASADASGEAYVTSRWVVIGFAVGSIALALILGYAISWSVIGPVRQMDARLRDIASGDFSGQVQIANRDELGALAANLNRMNRELGRLYQQLEAASRHKSEFLANMSHELRTPLNAIIGFSEVLHERMFGELNDKQAEYVQDIVASGRHLLSLINDILDLSKIEAGRMELDLGTFSLPVALDTALTLVRERATRHGITLTLTIDERLGDVLADERKVKQILLNLLSNAVKFTPDGGRIRLAAAVADGSVEISVSDTGIGIAPEDQEAIFEEFRQVGGDYTRKREGTGLGLTLTKKFVEMHGGTIWVKSEPGQGSTFTFTFPLRAG
ncbi:MAG TPA: ATP-binding protein [Methylomirabilota bacterium]|jgi:signal transduction histidine kinase|nr:ATP-binding protein [Methylomirabilota bacterium]